MGLFDDPTSKNVTGGLFRAGESLTAGGTLSQAALAALNNDPQPDGLPGEAPIVDTGVRPAGVWDAEMKHVAMVLTLAVVGFVVLYGIAAGSK